jgi:hypothetical protein
VNRQVTEAYRTFLSELGQLAALVQTLDIAKDAWGRGATVTTPSNAARHLALEEDDPFMLAFDESLRNPKAEMPAALYRMCFVYASSLFDDYLSSLLRALMRGQPKMLLGGGPKPKTQEQSKLNYSQIINLLTDPGCSNPVQALLDTMIDKELRDMAYGSRAELLARLRDRYGFKRLTMEHDSRLIQLSHIRNCVVHNKCVADDTLATLSTNFYRSGCTILIDRNFVSRSMTTYRRMAQDLNRIAHS